MNLRGTQRKKEKERKRERERGRERERKKCDPLVLSGMLLHIDVYNKMNHFYTLKHIKASLEK